MSNVELDKLIDQMDKPPFEIPGLGLCAWRWDEGLGTMTLQQVDPDE